MAPPKVNVAKLKDQLQQLIDREKLKEALVVYAQLEQAEPLEVRWPQRKGDLQVRMKLPKDAVESYVKAVDLYVKQGFITRAAALAKVVVGLDPARRDVLERVDPSAVRGLRDASVAGRNEAPMASTIREVPRGAVSPVASIESPSASPAALTTGGQTSDPTLERLSFVLEAPLLEVDASADADELRFVDAPAAEPMHFEPEEIVVVVDDDDEPVLMVDDDLPDLDRLVDMASIPLFADVPQDALTRMLELADLVELEDEGKLIERGADADSLFILAEGRAEVVLENGATVPLSEGEVVGETCLFPDMRRGADVVAKGRLRALCLDRHALEVLANKWPELASVLYNLLTRRLVQNLLRNSAIFAAFDLPTRLEVGRMFEVRRASPGTTILMKGKRADGLYVHLLGGLEANFEDGTKRPVPTGTMLGEQSMLGHLPAKATVVSSTEAVLLRLPSHAFNDLAARFPTVLGHLAELSSRGSFEDLGRGDLHIPF